MLDYIIRHQSAFWLMLGVISLITLLAVWGYKLFCQLRRGSGNSGGGNVMEVIILFSNPFPKWLVPSVLLILVVFGVLVAVKPLPKTTALEFPAPIRQTAGNNALIVFIHGWQGDPTETWKQFPELLKKDKRFDGYDVLSLSYPTYISRRSLTIPQLAQWLTEQMKQRGYYSKYNNIFIIAHSLGGLVAREVVIENRLGSVPNNVRKLVEIATPHTGANIAGLALALGIDRAYVREVEPSSRYLADLRDKWNHLDPRPATFAITSVEDQVVTTASAEEQCDRYRVFPQWSHTELAKPGSANDDRYMFVMDQIGGGSAQ